MDLEQLEQDVVNAAQKLVDYLKQHDEVTDEQMETVERVEQKVADLITDMLAEKGYVVGDERVD